ncbi:hypothetical protein ACUY3K_07320 [Corynebacterium uberis]|uniref:hypothetical protein n=1 Tax=Corynebacterium TaxID=1716 RepID=UPI001D09EF58|nr:MULTISPECIES: hypothetical protein [Corynebacterium]MCZ9308879.1 hypothetical protein [Corynebacterium sp. c6VSa_13]UDL74644.1 hypothetical protein LH391_05520 [Corynebacterium uberis]UDL76522.1 hypothetical protein LH393_03885 [Corynebacterium uberis]UDL78734.1 hypothetical protein LH394_03870 [Corynebacterium uberis]UDL81013.1 hypothetical protein LH392_04295 [Corynebacterium uberis]
MTDSIAAITVLAAQGGPVGAEFGKASPIGLLVTVALMAAVLYLGWALHRRYARLNRRRVFAEEHGLDLFDEEAVDKAMAEAGVLDRSKKHWL